MILICELLVCFSGIEGSLFDLDEAFVNLIDTPAVLVTTIKIYDCTPDPNSTFREIPGRIAAVALKHPPHNLHFHLGL